MKCMNFIHFYLDIYIDININIQIIKLKINKNDFYLKKIK